MMNHATDMYGVEAGMHVGSEDCICNLIWWGK